MIGKTLARLGSKLVVDNRAAKGVFAQNLRRPTAELRATQGLHSVTN